MTIINKDHGVKSNFAKKKRKKKVSLDGLSCEEKISLKFMVFRYRSATIICEKIS